MTNRSFQPTQLRGVNRDARTVDIVASDFSLDSYGTRIDPAGWDLEQFKKNPVICLQHDSYSSLPVASALPDSVRVENGKLVMTVQFPPEGTTDDADEAFGLIAAGVLRGVSVGFDPSEWKDVDEDTGGFKQKVRVYTKQRLMEVSFVTIPSNDNGLVVRARELNADERQIREMTEKLEATLKKSEKTVTLRIADLPEFQAEVQKLRDQVEGMQRDYDKYKGYFESKQPANRAATKVLEKFYKRILKEEQPAEEAAAWDRMGEAIEAMEEEAAKKPEEKPVEKPEEQVVTETAETTVEEKPSEPTPPAPEAPEPARKASVQISLDTLAELPLKMTRAHVEAGVEALRQGIPVKDALALIDGLKEAAPISITKS